MKGKKVKEETEKKEEKKEEKKVEKKPVKKLEAGVQGIVHIAETDLDGSKKVAHALLKIKGIGHATAKAVVQRAGINPNEILGKLTEEQLKKLEEVVLNLHKYNMPAHLLNRPVDPLTGETKHLVASELTITHRADIDFMKKIRCYKGIRHELGLPVRGQRTRSSFRTGMLVGVAKGAQKQAAQQPAKTGEKAAAPQAQQPAQAKAQAPQPKAQTKPEAKKEEK